jgi:anti-sigma B factor antagonist
MPSGPQPQGHYLVAANHDSFYVRVVGLATMNNSPFLQEVLEDFRTRGYHRFIFDLETCSGFDSTFMGIILGVALSGNGKSGGVGAPGTGGASVILVNCNQEHTRLLSGVGVDRMVRLSPTPIQCPLELQRLEDRPPDPLRRMRSVMSAHENLVKLGGGNHEKFGALVEALRRELGGDGRRA